MKSFIWPGCKVRVSKSALRRAHKQHGTRVASDGEVQAVSDGLASVLHQDGQVVDWRLRSLTKLERQHDDY